MQYIQVADALIAPDSMRVRIGRNAKMHPLVDATITANFVNKYHTIHSATVNISARRQYSGSGIYDYKDETGKTFPIDMKNVNVDTSFQTYALGRVPQEENFQLSPAFDFFGDVLWKRPAKSSHSQATPASSTIVLAYPGTGWASPERSIQPRFSFPSAIP